MSQTLTDFRAKLKAREALMEAALGHISSTPRSTLQIAADLDMVDKPVTVLGALERLQGQGKIETTDELLTWGNIDSRWVRATS